MCGTRSREGKPAYYIQYQLAQLQYESFSFAISFLFSFQLRTHWRRSLERNLPRASQVWRLCCLCCLQRFLKGASPWKTLSSAYMIILGAYLDCLCRKTHTLRWGCCCWRRGLRGESKSPVQTGILALTLFCQENYC